jgi:hypothetical protein
MKRAQQASEKLSVAYKAQFLHSAKTLENPTLQNWAEIRVFTSKYKIKKWKAEEIYILHARKHREIGVTQGAKMSKRKYSDTQVQSRDTDGKRGGGIW